MRPEAHFRPDVLPPSSTKKNQGGFGLIDAMVAVVIFGFGMSALAALYVRAAPQPYQNTAVVQVQDAANSLIGTLTANPSVLPINVSGVTSSAGMPAALQNWFTQSAAALPGFTVTSIASGPDAAGNACSAISCGVTFVLSWTQLGTTRQQTFYAQIGIS